MFKLKHDINELESSNSGASRSQFDQVPPSRDVTTTNFANGSIHFKFQTAGTRWWIPSHTYLRMRLQLTKGDGTRVDTAFGVAPNMGLMSNLFQSAEFKINDKTVSRVSDYMAQVDALDQRITKSKSWLETVGESTNWWQASQSLRLAEVASDGQIVKNTVAVVPTEQTSLDTAIGYPAAPTVQYTAATGVVTFGNGSNTNQAFQIGDYLVLTDGTIGNGAKNVKLEVLVVNANRTMTVRAAIADDIAANADIRFSRIRVVPVAAPNSRQVGEFETVWQTPLSIFKIPHALPPGAKYELVLTPHNSSVYMKRAIESVLGQASKTQGLTAGDVKLNVVNFYLYSATVEGPRVDNITYLLDLKKIRCQADKIDSNSFGQKNFEVSPSTYALTVAYQDQRSGEHTSISSSKFRSYDNAADPTQPQELKLNRFYINYAGQNLPAPDADPSFQAGNDYTTQRYLETQLYTGAYYDTGGAETIDDYHSRGAYYYFKWDKDGTDNSTRTTIYQQFNGAEYANMRVLLFDHSRDVAKISITDSRVTDVSVEEV